LIGRASVRKSIWGLNVWDRTGEADDAGKHILTIKIQQYLCRINIYMYRINNYIERTNEYINRINIYVNRINT
jgi:hypothetical protein